MDTSSNYYASSNRNGGIKLATLLASTLLLIQWTNIGASLPLARRIDKRQEESLPTSTPCSLSYYRYLFNSTVGERIRPPIAEGSSIFGVVLKSPDHYYPETKSDYGQKQDPIPLPSGQLQMPVLPPSGQKPDPFPSASGVKNAFASPYLPPSLPPSPPSGQNPDPFPSASGVKNAFASPYLPPSLPPPPPPPSGQKPDPFPSASGVKNAFASPYLPPSLPPPPPPPPSSEYLPAPKPNDNYPISSSSGSDSSVVQTPFLPAESVVNEIPIRTEEKPSSKVFVKSAASDNHASSKPKCECVTARKEENNNRGVANSELPFVDITNVPIDEQPKAQPKQQYYEKKDNPPISSGQQTADTIVRSSAPSAFKSNVKGAAGKKGYYDSPIAAPSEEVNGYEYPAPSAPSVPSTVVGQSYQPPPSPPPPPPRPYPVNPPQSYQPSPEPSISPSSSTAVGYKYPKPNPPFPLPDVEATYPSESKTPSLEPQPSEGYFYNKPNVAFDLPSIPSSNYGSHFVDSNKVDSVLVQTNDNYNEAGGLFQGENFNGVSGGQPPIDDLLVLHVK